MLFWFYYGIVAAAALFLIRAIIMDTDWRVQVSAALALLPLALRIFLIK